MFGCKGLKKGLIKGCLLEIEIFQAFQIRHKYFVEKDKKKTNKDDEINNRIYIACDAGVL